MRKYPTHTGLSLDFLCWHRGLFPAPLSGPGPKCDPKPAPKWFPKRPKRRPRPPKRPPRRPKMLSRRPKRPPRLPKRPPRRPKRGSWEPFRHRRWLEDRSGTARGSLGDRKIPAQGSPVGDKRGYNYPLGVVKSSTVERRSYDLTRRWANGPANSTFLPNFRSAPPAEKVRRAFGPSAC